MMSFDRRQNVGDPDLLCVRWFGFRSDCWGRVMVWSSRGPGAAAPIGRPLEAEFVAPVIRRGPARPTVLRKDARTVRARPVGQGHVGWAAFGRSVKNGELQVREERGLPREIKYCIYSARIHTGNPFLHFSFTVRSVMKANNSENIWMRLTGRYVTTRGVWMSRSQMSWKVHLDISVILVRQASCDLVCMIKDLLDLHSHQRHNKPIYNLRRVSSKQNHNVDKDNHHSVTSLPSLIADFFSVRIFLEKPLGWFFHFSVEFSALRNNTIQSHLSHLSQFLIYFQYRT